MPVRSALIFPCLLATLCLSASSRAENWPQWRGAKLDGISTETGVPTKWSKTENVAWRLPLPGPAGSTPVVWDDRIYLTSVAGDDLVVLCVGTDGKQIWKQTLATGNQNVRSDEGNSASPSPVTDGKHVWAMMTTGDLACYTKDGQEVWKTNLQDRYGKFKIQFGMTSSPVLDSGRLYLQFIHGEMRGNSQDARVVCLDAATGDEVWEVERLSDGTFENRHSYASPVMYRDAERTFLLTHGNDYVVAHDLQDGHEIWRCGDLNPKGNYEPTLRFVASPVAVPGYIVVPTAKNRGVVCLKPGGQGDITNDTKLTHWKRDSNTPDVPSPLVVDGLVYLCRENGNLMCLDANTGEEHYKDETTTRDRHRASPVYADGHIYTTARKGVVTVVKAGPKFEIVAQNDLGESTAASPVISNGRIYVRTFDALYAIGK
jgi:outer membrane protein assembly factor BamB